MIATLTSIEPYLLLALGWAFYFFIHSFLASNKFKRWRSHPFFRIVYIILAVAGLLVLMVWNGMVDGTRYFPDARPVRYISLVLTTLGVIIIREAFRQFSIKGFMGLKEEENKLKTGGILQYMRHPLYAGLILITLSYILFSPTTATLVSSACIFLYLAIGIRLEESKLLRQFGEEYRAYCRRVPMLIPRFRRTS